MEKASSMLGFSFSCLTAWGASCFERWCADGVGAREGKGNEGKGKEWLETGGEKKPLGMSELGCADGCGRQMGGEKKPLEISELACADGCGRRGCKVEMGEEKKALGMSELGCTDGRGRRGCKGVAGNGWGEEAAGDERAWLRDGCGRQMGGEKKPLEISELACADGCGRRGCKVEMGEEKKALGMSELGCTDGRGRRGCKRVAGNGWGEEAAGDERAWLRDGYGRRGWGAGGHGWGEEAAGDERAWLRGRLRTAWVQESGWKWVGRRRRWG